MEQTKFVADLPYPTMEGIEKDSWDLQLVRNDFSGQISEFSAIAQYVYHQLMAREDGFSHIGRSLLSIAQVEMRHLNILGEMIGKLGGDPRFCQHEGCCATQWRGDFVAYGSCVEEMIQKDLQLERQTIQCYRRQADRVHQRQVATVLRRLILDEEIHVGILQGLLVDVEAMPAVHG